MFGPFDSERATEVDAHHAIVLTTDGDRIEVQNKGNEILHFILIGGKPIGEPIVQHGPFVMNTNEEIKKAMDDFRHGKNAFEGANVWSSAYQQ